MTENYYHANDVARIKHCSIAEVYSLLKTKQLKGHQVGRRKKWLIDKDQEAFRHLAIQQDTSKDSSSHIEFIADEKHHSTILLNKIAGVKSSLKIACAKLSNFVIHKDNNSYVSLCDFLFQITKKKVYVEIICMEAYKFFDWVSDNCPELVNSGYFHLLENKHNHMKIFLFDKNEAYMGSANLTSAALDFGRYGTPNYEAGILVQGGDLLNNLQQQYLTVREASETEVVC